jgi:hypothetical protein
MIEVRETMVFTAWLERLRDKRARAHSNPHRPSQAR